MKFGTSGSESNHFSTTQIDVRFISFNVTQVYIVDISGDLFTLRAPDVNNVWHRGSDFVWHPHGIYTWLTLTGSFLFGLNLPNSSSHSSNLSASDPHFAHFRTVLLWNPSNLVVRDAKTLFAALGFLTLSFSQFKKIAFATDYFEMDNPFIYKKILHLEILILDKMNSTLKKNIFKSIWNFSAKSIYLLNNLSLALKTYAQRGARTHDRWIKSPTLYRLS